MKCIYVLLVMTILSTADNQEDINIDYLLSNPKHVKTFLDCFLDKAPCNDVGASLKKDIPDVIFYACDKCTPEEKHIVNAFIDNFKKDTTAYEEFIEKYDPERKYVANLEAAVAQF